MRSNLNEKQSSENLATSNADNFTKGLVSSRQLLDSKINKLYTIVFGIYFFVCAMEKNISSEVATGIISALIGYGLLTLLAWLNEFITVANPPDGVQFTTHSNFVKIIGGSKWTFRIYYVLILPCVISLIIPPIASVIAILTFELPKEPAIGCDMFPKFFWCS